MAGRQKKLIGSKLFIFSPSIRRLGVSDPSMLTYGWDKPKKVEVKKLKRARIRGRQAVRSK